MTGRILFINYNADVIKINGRDNKTYFGTLDIDLHFELEIGMFVEFIAGKDHIIGGDRYAEATDIKFLHRGLTIV